MGCAFGKPPTEEDGGGATEVPARRVVAPPVVPSYVAGAAGGAATWPVWLTEVAGEAIRGWVPRRAESFQMLGKIGQGTYSNVYKARDIETGKMVALKKVRFDSLERESVKFMAREISILRRLDHPNVIKLQGMVISRVSTSLYLVFDYLEHDLSGLLSSPEVHFTLPQIKSFMKQLLSGLEHCHSQGVMHRDIKGANLLLSNDGVLKIADFGLALHRRFGDQRRMTSRVVTLWYRPPELLLGSTSYGFGVDLWSAGCVLGELLCGRPILPGRTEVEQLHKIFKLCGSPGEDYCRKLGLPKMAAVFNAEPPYPSTIAQTFHHFPPSALSLITKLLSLDPSNRGTATSALNSEFLSESPESCEMSLAHYRPTKELDAKMRDELARGRSKESKEKGAAPRKPCPQSRRRARPAPEANAELQINIDRRRLIVQMAAKSKSEKFPPPHRDGNAGIRPEEEQPRNQHLSFVARPERSFESSLFDPKSLPEYAFPTAATKLHKKKQETTTQLARGPNRRRIKSLKTDSQVAPAQMYVSTEFNKDVGRLRVDGRFKGKEIKASG